MLHRKEKILKKVFILLLMLTYFQTAITRPAILLSSANFRDGSSGAPANALRLTYTIAQPGIYMLAEDIIANTSQWSTLLITSSNVTLDLNGYRIAQVNPGNSNLKPNGITVEQELRNITIKNGTLSDIAASGIYVSKGVTHIKISNITLNGCNYRNDNTAGAAGISVDGSSLLPIENCVIDYCVTQSVTPQSVSAYGIHASYNNYLTISNCKVDGVRNIGKSYEGIGYYLQDCKSPLIKDSTAVLCEGDLIGAGFYLLTCTGAQISGCRSDSNASSPTYAASSVTTGTGAGFYLNNSWSSTVKNCEASANSSGVTASGFLIESCSNSQFLDCTASGQSVSNATLGMEATGFRTARTLTNPTQSRVESCLFKNCTAFGNRGSENPNTDAAGFLLGPQTRYSMIEGCTSFGNFGSLGTVYGIYLQGETLLNQIKNNLCTSNSINNNSGNNDNTAYGIKDEAADSFNIYYENICTMNFDGDSVTPGGTQMSVSTASPSIATNQTFYQTDTTSVKGYNFTADVFT
jgi:hypothetical protein